MKKLLLALAFTATAATQCLAQAVEGAYYYLPKTELRFKLFVEKTVFTPGEFAIYADRYLKKTAPTDASESFRLVGIEMYTTSIPDTTDMYVLPMDKKHTIFKTDMVDGILLAINTNGTRPQKPSSRTFHPTPKAPNPHDYMSEDILKASSTAKMAELTAREIYDIRASRNELSRGEADYMPKDGQQLKLMFQNLDRQEDILTQTFMGSNLVDTLEQEITYVPEKEGREMLFRFSKKLGMVDCDDLSGTPYYINIEDLHIIPEADNDVAGMKPSKETPIVVMMPGKIKATISEGKNAIKSFETNVAQFGEKQELSANLFGRKFTTRLRLNSVNGGIESMETEALE